METQETPKLTQRMTLHLNGGSEFSSLSDEILADDKPTGITRHTKTNGSPRYLKVADELHCGEDTFDILAARGDGMGEWIRARIKQEKAV